MKISTFIKFVLEIVYSPSEQLWFSLSQKVEDRSLAEGAMVIKLLLEKFLTTRLTSTFKVASNTNS